MRYSSQFYSVRRLTSLFGALLAVFGGVYFFNVDAKTDDVKNLPEDNFVNGRLAFSRRLSGPTAPEGTIITSNPDGSSQSTLPTPLSLSAAQPVWSPDGTKLLFVSTQPLTFDIFVINADGSGQTNLTNTSAPIIESNPSWSVAGKIAYERDSRIWTMNTDGAAQAEFTAITQPSPTAPAWSPDGMKLAFVSGGEIWVINSDGTNQTRVTNNATPDNDPAWSPDGTRIVFRKSNGIAVINSDGTNEAPLAAAGTSPSWSPDGTKIAYHVSGASSGGIFTMDASGANQVRIVANITNSPNCCDIIYENPAWQPVAQTPNTFNITGRVAYNNLPVTGATVNLSGTIKAAATTDAAGNYQFSSLPAGGNYTVSTSYTRHYFTPANRSFNNLTSNQTGVNFEVLAVCVGGKCVKNGKLAFMFNSEIFTINSDGTSQTNITNNGATDTEPHYSPYGTNIIFTTNRDGNNEIYQMGEDGINPVRLTNNAASDTSPFYSPDATWIVFVSSRDGNSEIYRMNADGTNQIRLTNESATDTSPSVSPDGQKIIFLSRRSGNEKVFSMNSDGTNQQLLSDAAAIAPGYNRPSYSPDASKIIFGYSPDTGTTHPTVWTMNADGTNRTQITGGRYPTYSADGIKVAFACCYNEPFLFPPRLRVINSTGGSEQSFSTTISTSGPEFPSWQGFRIGRAKFDFDGDGRSDISVFRPSEGVWYLLRSTAGFTASQWGLSTDVLTPADYDGDLKTDVAVWRPSDGNFYILNSFDSTVRIENFGLAGDVPTGGDWDGDGKADVVVYRAGAQSVFYYRGSMGNPQGNITFVSWGINGDKPVVGDYDGDGRDDAAIYRSGIWYIRQSSNGQLVAGNFGLANDVLVPDDYDGDGKTDLAVFRDGIWYLLQSARGFGSFQFGIAGDVPTPADYDGDGRADAAIYRNGGWWILKSQSGAAEALPFGLGSDKPIPSAFVR